MVYECVQLWIPIDINFPFPSLERMSVKWPIILILC